VAGQGVLPGDMFRLSGDANWTWEDLDFNSTHPIEYYSVYSGTPGGNFDCIQSTTAIDWIGDPANPAPGEVFGYLVTATNAGGVEASGGGGRVLNQRCSAPPIAGSTLGMAGSK
jgi:hypothetical protein